MWTTEPNMSAEKDVSSVRSEFPALLNCPGYIFGDAPTGTQFHGSIAKAMHDYMDKPGAHLLGNYPGAVNTIRTTTEARVCAASLFNCKPEEVTFGPNMTSLTFNLARSLATHIKELPGYPNVNVVVTNLDHDANVSPWVRMCEDIQVELRRVNFRHETCTLDLGDMDRKVDQRTALVCVGLASNACGTINPLQKIIKQVRSRSNALVFVDAVHYAPHAAMDVVAFDCDFCVCSTFKFFGPHAGLLFGRASLMRTLRPYKLSVCVDTLPGPPHPDQFQRWETGTLNFEGLAGIAAVVKYIASLGDRFGKGCSDASTLRTRIEEGYGAIQRHEAILANRFLTGISSIQGLRIYGIRDADSVARGVRTPTFAMRMDCFKTAGQLADAMLKEKIISGAGHFYARYFAEGLGLQETGGYVRIGFVHYNNLQEIDKVVRVLGQISQEANKNSK